MMPSHHFCHHFNWVLGIKTLARPNIELIGNAVQLLEYTQASQCSWAGTAGSCHEVFVATVLP
jgi:hypothetical protein